MSSRVARGGGPRWSSAARTRTCRHNCGCVREPEPVSAMLDVASLNPAHVRGAQRWLLLFSLATVFFVLLALYCGVLSVLLPNQIQGIDPANKARNLAIVFAITSVFSTTITPIAGALSDRTRSRFGRRTPWIVLGSVVGGTSLMISSQMQTLWTIIFFWVLAGASLNSMQAALTTIIADRFPEKE